ncbi:hypothetical protein PUN28_010280 [Cardiocondyla obscurior]|uniref:Uncharacterized protein n=1 Tax=Cardiocondyla obscurior TaxID=286306 RepID=A0AAW2FPF4_9HYME
MLSAYRHHGRDDFIAFPCPGLLATRTMDRAKFFRCSPRRSIHARDNVLEVSLVITKLAAQLPRAMLIEKVHRRLNISRLIIDLKLVPCFFLFFFTKPQTEHRGKHFYHFYHPQIVPRRAFATHIANVCTTTRTVSEKKKKKRQTVDCLISEQYLAQNVGNWDSLSYIQTWKRSEMEMHRPAILRGLGITSE